MKCYKGRILTVNENNDTARYLVEDQGIIQYVGDTLPGEYRRAEMIDLGGRALIPSFVDTHQHFASFATFHSGLNVMDAASNEEILGMIQACRPFLRQNADRLRRVALFRQGAAAGQPGGAGRRLSRQGDHGGQVRRPRMYRQFQTAGKAGRKGERPAGLPP